MKFAIAILAAFALLLAGCASSPQAAQAPEQQATPPAAVPPAPGNDAPPAMPPGAQSAPSPTQEVTATGTAGITLAVLAQHNKESDCWVGYDGEVYDITAFIPNHKNYRELIVPLYGSPGEFKAKFEGKHGLSKVSILTGQALMGTLVAQ